MVERRKLNSKEVVQVDDESMNTNESGAKVTVACKMPHGLILRLFKMEEHREPIIGKVSQAKQYGPVFTIKGWYDSARAAFGTEVPIPSQVGGYALTHNIPKEFWDKWYAQNKDSDIVRNKLIFASSKADTIEAMKKENKAVKSGLEPIDPKAPPRDVRRVTEMTPDEEL
jgi:hypothetical protein